MSDTALMQAQTAHMGEEPTQGSSEVIYLDGVPVPVWNLNFTELSRFEQKLTIGAYNKDSDALLSAWIQNSWNGGLLLDEHIEGGTDQRSRWSTLWTRSPGQLALNPLAITTSFGDGLHLPIGDYDGRFWLAEDATLHPFDDPGTSFALTSIPVERGVVFRDKLYIPLGSSGLDVFDGATIAHNATIKAVSFLIWDDKLFTITTDGELVRHDGVAWGMLPVVAGLKLPSDRIPRKLVEFFDRGANLTVVVVTNRDMWAWDTEANVLHRIRMKLPPHPDNGMASGEWRDDALYYSAGLGIYRHSSSGVITAMGLDRDDGVPVEYRGRIVDFFPEHNGLLALVQGSPVATEPLEEDAGFESGPQSSGFDFDTQLAKAQSAIMLWNEAGWHCLHAFRELITPTWLYLSESEIDNHDYTFFAGYEGGIAHIKLPKIFFGPRQLVQSQVTAFEPDGIHYTGRFDAGMTGFDKLSSHFEMTLRDPRSGLSAEGSVQVAYRTDLQENWVDLGSVTGYGRTVLPFNKATDGFVLGEAWNWIEFRYVVQRGTTVTMSPVIDSTVLKFIKLPLQGDSWTCTVDLEHIEDWRGFGPNEIADHLGALTRSRTFTRMVHEGRTYRVRVSQAQGVEATHNDHRKAMSLSIVAIPIPGYGEAA